MSTDAHRKASLLRAARRACRTASRFAAQPLRLAGLLPALLLAATAPAAELTIDRLFAAPDLAGDSLRQPQLSPDGRLVTYLKAAADDRDRLDLWAWDVARREHRLLVDARALAPTTGPLDAEEAARRERARTSSLSGIVEYHFAPDGRRLLVPLAGDLYLVDLAAPAASAVRRLTRTESWETDARFSPRGRYVSFIRDRSLHVLELATGAETALTPGATDTVSFGMAEFIAQEEMDRTTGYWWSPDESRVAYTRVDESPVAETERFEIDARSVRVVRQRYPATGQPNAAVALFVAPVAAPQAVVRADLGPDPDFYLARVAFFPDSRALAVQVQSRDQRRLDLLRVDAVRGSREVLLTERSSTWVPLHDELTFLPARRQFIWASARDGSLQLYLHALDGRLLRQLTRGPLPVAGDRNRPAIRGVDEKRGRLYVMTPGDNPRERQLVEVRLDRDAPPRQITTGAGWHSVTLADNAGVFLDSFSNVDTPPTLRLHAIDGRLLHELVPNRLAPGHPYFPYAADHAPTEFGTLTAADGQTLHYSLLKPRHLQPGRRYPVVVHVYGGPGVQSVTNAWGGSWQMFQQILVRRGFVVFTLDNRGSGGREVRFEAALHRRLGTVEVEDQLAGVRFLRTLPFVDGARIGVMGWSYGGYMALLSLLQGPDAFAAGIAGAPVTDWRLYDTHYTERYLGTPADNPAGYAGADVLPQATALRRPLLLVHGMADDNVLFTHSTALMRVLQTARIPFGLMTYPGGKHGLIRHQDDGPHALAGMLAFLERELQGDPRAGASPGTAQAAAPAAVSAAP